MPQCILYSNMICIFTYIVVPLLHDDPMVNKFGIVVLLGLVWVYAGKRKSFGRGRRKNEFARKERGKKE